MILSRLALTYSIVVLRRKIVLLRGILYLLLIYMLVSLYAILFSNRSIFPIPKSSYTDHEGILKIKTQDGSLISAIYLSHPNAIFTVLMNHGNGEDLGTIEPLMKKFYDHGFSVFAYDYEGYGTSAGKPTEKNTTLDVNAAYEYLTQELHLSPTHLIVYGRSLGAAVAIDLAYRKPIGGLIIESPFLTAYRTVTQIPLLLFDKFNNLKKIKKITCPILIIHGKKDSVIPFWHGKKLYKESISSSKDFLWVENADHNDIESLANTSYWKAINDFSEKLKR